MASDKKAATNYLTKGILVETEQRFSSIKWFLNFLGTTLESEPEFAKFFENEIGTGLLMLQQSSRGALGISPLLVRDIDSALRRMLMLGYYLGGRRFDRGLMGETAIKPTEEEPSTSPTGDVGEEDFQEPQPPEGA